MSNHNDKNRLNSGKLSASKVGDNPEPSYPIYTNHNKSKAEQTATPSKYPQGYFKDKECRMCGSLFKPKAPSELYCSDKCKDLGVTNKYLLRNYGIDIDYYNKILKLQNNKCALCGSEGFVMKECHTAKLVVDHDHKTNKVRGLLCHNCNRALGLLQDNPEVIRRCAEWVEGATTIQKWSSL